MRSTRLVLGCLALVLAGQGRADDGAADVPPATPPAATGPLRFAFNGRDLAGFSTFLRHAGRADPRRVFAVEGGCLRISGAEFGGITTEEAFGDYHLVAEWRWGGPTHYPRRWRARNSGIIVHAAGPEGGGLGSWMAGYESQLIEGGCGDLIVVPGQGRPPPRLRAEVRTGGDGQPYYEAGGKLVARAGGRLNWWGRDPAWRDVLWFRGPADLDGPVGAWNRTELVCAGDRVACYLNGRLVNAARDLSVREGRVLFQSEGAEIRFRKIEIRGLPATPRRVEAAPTLRA